jgi:hypothetical protein
MLMVASAAACEGSTETSAGSPSTSLSVSSASEGDEAIWSSASTTEMFDDPLGDSIPQTVPFLDAVAYGVGMAPGDAKADTYLFRFEVAEPIPASFEVPLDHDAVQYSFCLDTDPADPGGYPFASLEPVPCDFILTAVSDGGSWTGTLIDRRRLATGGEAKTPRVPFLTKEANGLFVVPGDKLGNPGSFDWAMTASLLMLPLPSDDFIDLDANYEHMLTFKPA